MAFSLHKKLVTALPLGLVLLPGFILAQSQIPNAQPPSPSKTGIAVTNAAGPATKTIIVRCRPLLISEKPLFVVDGVPIPDEPSNKGRYDINPDNIESVAVIRAPEAARLYGSRAVNGVILITTKKPIVPKKKHFHSDEIKKAGLE